MLVFSYGMPKSGSTLAFQLARGVARMGGHRQALLPPPLVAAGHRVNFLQDLDPAALPALVRHAGDRILVVKTHNCPSPEWVAAYRALAAQGLASVQVNHRDPRDTALSLLDAGVLARSRGEAAFSEFVTLEDAEAAVHRYLGEMRVWSALPRLLPLRYEVCAFRTDSAIDALKAEFGVRGPNWPVRSYVQRLAFTWRNKAVPARHRDELDAATIARLSESFAPYLTEMGYASGAAPPWASAMAM